MKPETITSKDNVLLKAIRRLSREGGFNRKTGEVWVEGDHLVRAAIERGWTPQVIVWTPSAWARWQLGVDWSGRHVVIEDQMMRGLSQLESAAALGAVFRVSAPDSLAPGTATVVLDGLQDPGNVGSILRTASAMGFKQVLATKGTVGLWSAKVLRAGMGAHFNLRLLEQVEPDQLHALQLPLLATHVHEGVWLHETNLPMPCAWLLGHEGQGLSAELLALAQQKIRIHQVGGEESLNVAAAAAICLHASATGR